MVGSSCVYIASIYCQNNIKEEKPRTPCPDLKKLMTNLKSISKIPYFFKNCIDIYLFIISFLYSTNLNMFYVSVKDNWNKSPVPWGITVQSKRQATGIKRDTAWSQECNVDFRYPDTPFLMPGTLTPLGLCSARAQLLLSPFWAPGIEWFKLVLWQLVNTWPFLFGLPWSFFLYQTSQTAHNFPPDKINHSFLWAPQTLRTHLFF